MQSSSPPKDSPSSSPQSPRRRESIAQRFSNVVQKTKSSIVTNNLGITLPSAAMPFTPMTAEILSQEIYTLSVSLNPEDYTLLKPIGYGSSAMVYLATYKPLNKEVAIKMIDLDLFERNQIDELRRELQIMTLSRHPNLLPVYGSFVNDAKLYIVTPFLSAGSCLDIIKNAFPDGLDEVSIATVLKSCLQGLDYLHKNGHIHRDVKAGNLLMNADGSVLLADFGVSSSLMEEGERKSQRRTFVGTPCWMAPEVLSPERGYDYKADIWSFGITAIELACGRAPYANLPPLKVLMMTLSQPPPSLNRENTKHKFSRSFSQMIDLCLQKDPTKRPTAEKLLEHSFFKQAKKKDYLTKSLLFNLLPITQRPVIRPPTKPKSFERGVTWDFDTGDLDYSNSETASASTPSPNSSASNNDLKELSTIPEEKTFEKRGRFSLNTAAAGSDEKQSPQPSPQKHEPRRSRFEVTSLDRPEKNRLVRFASISSSSSTLTAESDNSSLDTFMKMLEEQKLALLSHVKEEEGSRLVEEMSDWLRQVLSENNRLKSENFLLKQKMERLC